MGYSNEEFDAAMATALQAPSRSAAYEAYREAELLLVSDPPSVPLWFAATPFAHSTHVTDVRINSYGTLDLLAVRAA